MALEGKVVVVTGAARGMGRAYVQGFLERGARVAALDRSWIPTGVSGDRDDAFARELDGRDDALKVTCDITDVEQIRDACDATIGRFGTVDVLINNASLRQIDLFPPVGSVTTLETTDSSFEKMFAVSVFGTLKVTRAFIQPMIEKRRGSIIAVSSGGGMTVPDPDGISWTVRRPNSREQPYQSAKAAVTALFGYLAEEIKPHNVAVNIINPTSAKTTGYEERAVARAAASGRGEALSRTGTGPARPEHVVPIALFLADQDAGNGVTGRVFDVMAWNAAHGHGGPEVWAAE